MCRLLIKNEKKSCVPRTFWKRYWVLLCCFFLFFLNTCVSNFKILVLLMGTIVYCESAPYTLSCCCKYFSCTKSAAGNIDPKKYTIFSCSSNVGLKSIESIKRWTVALLVWLFCVIKKKEEKDSNQVNVCYVFVIRLVIVRFLLNGQISTQKSSIVRALVLTIFQSM